MGQRLWSAPTGGDKPHYRDQDKKERKNGKSRPVNIRADHASSPQLLLRHTIYVSNELIGTQAI
jgi:hypothetical protein